MRNEALKTAAVTAGPCDLLPLWPAKEAHSIHSVLIFGGSLCLSIDPSRKFLGCINHKKIQATNRNCEVTADVRHDGSEPLVDVMFADGERLVMKGANLTTIEMLTALGSRCNAKELKEEQKSKKSP
nr:PREDICTED: 39S ribosomal protein L53, mitochondrial [Pelecanus crispus]